MKIALLNMPVAGSIAQPYSAIAYLAGALESAGHEVMQRDLNLEGWDFLLSEPFLDRARQRFRDKTSAYIDNAGTKNIASSNLAARRDRLFYAKMEKIIPQVSQAKQSLRRPDTFFDIRSSRSSAEVLTKCCELISRAFLPTILHPTAYFPSEGLSQSSRLAEAVDHPETNVFKDLLVDNVLPWLKTRQPQLVGISVTFGGQMITGLHLASLIRKVGLRTHLVLGGTYISMISQVLRGDSFLFRYFDTIVVNEGETAICELANHLEGRAGAKPLREIPNLIFPQDGELVRGPFHQENMSALSPPQYQPVRDWPYLAPYPVYLISSSRGCVGRCAFCTAPFYSCCGNGKRYRMISEDSLMEHIVTLTDLQPKDEKTYLYFADEMVATRFLFRIAKRMIKDGLNRRIRWICLGRLEGFTPEVCATLYEAGCREIFFGMESGNQRILDLMQKGTKLDTMSDAIRNTSRAGIAVFLSIIIGFPGEKPEEAEDSMQFVLNHIDDVFAAQFPSYFLAKYSTVWREPERFEITWETRPEEDFSLGTYEYRVRGGADPIKLAKLADSFQRRFCSAKPPLMDVRHFEVQFTSNALLYLDRFGKEALSDKASRASQA